jgi:hypothetical protein
MRERWEFSAAGGAVTPVVLWLLLVPWDLAAASTSHAVTGICGAVLIASAVGGGVAFADRTAGQAFVVAAYVATLLLFTVQSIAAHDLLWPFTLLIIALIALASFVVAFAIGRYLRARSTNTAVVTTSWQKPTAAVQVIVWLGLGILVAVTGAFVWLFVLGHGF